MLTLIKTGHPEEGRALSSLAPARWPLHVFVFVEERQSQEAARRVHQSSEQGAPAAGSLECGGERNLHCPIVPLFPRSHHTSSSLTGKRPLISPAFLRPAAFFPSTATLTDQQHSDAHAKGVRRLQTHTQREGKSSTQIWEDGDAGFPSLGHEHGNTEANGEKV